VAEREWREATDLKPATVWLAVTLAVAAVLRCWAPGHGIPFAVTDQEASLTRHVLDIMRSGDYNPHAVDLPGFAYWLHLPVACARFLVGAIRGEWTSLAGVSADALLPWARLWTASLGVVTVVLVHQIGMRWGARHALLAAGLLAVLPPHVAASHHATSAVPLALFTTLTFLLSLSAHERATPRGFACAGVAAGLATATDYAGVLALSIPLVAAWMTYPGRPSRVSYVLASLGAAAVAYLVVAPYTLLDLPGFLNGFGAFASAFRARPALPTRTWLAYLVALQRALGWPALVLLFAGLTMGIVRSVKGPGRVRWTLLVVFPVLVYVIVSRRGAPDQGALLPALPLATVLAATAVISGVSLLRRFSIPRAPRTALITALTVAALLPPFVSTVKYQRGLRRPTTAAAAWQWIAHYVAPDRKIAVEGALLRVPEDRYLVVRVRHLADHSDAEYREMGVSLLVGGPREAIADPGPPTGALPPNAYELVRFAPEKNRPGPEVRIYELR
jgi:4-amino-4-deoxy-L-arabinose transferase-like glycosyltransferase